MTSDLLQSVTVAYRLQGDRTGHHVHDNVREVLIRDECLLVRAEDRTDGYPLATVIWWEAKLIAEEADGS